MFSRILSRRTKAAAIITLLASSVLAPVAARAAETSCTSGSVTISGSKITGSLNCSGLLTVGSNITTIGSRAFENNSSITALIIPKNVVFIEQYAFKGANQLSQISFQNQDADWFSGASPSSYLEIDTEAFMNLPALVDLSLPNYLTKLHGESFQGATALETLIIPESVTLIGRGSFAGSPLETLVLGEKVEVIGSGAFEGLSSLVSLTIPESVTTIYPFAFQGMSSLLSLTIPDSVTSIGDSAFSGMSALTSLTFEETDASAPLVMGSAAFWGLESLVSLTTPNRLTVIPASAFEMWNTKLLSLGIAPSVTRIEERAFYGLGKILSLNIPKSVSYIGRAAFEDAKFLREISFEDQDEEWFSRVNPGPFLVIDSEAFINQRSLVSLRLPNYLSSIGVEAFRWSSALETLVIPDSVTTISANAFSTDSSMLKTLVLGAKVQTIGGSAFATSYSSMLASLTIPSSVTSIGSGAFFVGYSSKLTRLVIERGLVPLNLTLGEEAFRFASGFNLVCVSAGGVDLSPAEGNLDLSPGSYPACVPEVVVDSGTAATVPTVVYVPSVTYVPTPTEVVDVPESHQSSVFFAKGKASLDLNSKTSIQSFAKIFSKATAVKILVTSYRVGATSNKKEVALARARGAAVVAYFKARRIEATYQLLPSIRVKTAALASRVAIAVSAVLKVTRAKS